MGLIQLKFGYANDVDMDNDKVIELYDSYICKTLELLDKKNHNSTLTYLIKATNL